MSYERNKNIPQLSVYSARWYFVYDDAVNIAKNWDQYTLRRVRFNLYVPFSHFMILQPLEYREN